MQNRNSKIITKISSAFTSISSYIILLFQYVPATGIWFGIMSIPFLTYLTFFFQNPSILIGDIRFTFSQAGIYIVFVGISILIYSIIYQIIHRKQLLRGGPYKIIRHPQYFAFIIITLGLTIITFNTSPIFSFTLYNIDGYTLIFIIWIIETIVYIILAKIEEYSLKAKYGDEFIEYRANVPFMVPFLKIKSKK